MSNYLFIDIIAMCGDTWLRTGTIESGKEITFEIQFKFFLRHWIKLWSVKCFLSQINLLIKTSEGPCAALRNEQSIPCKLQCCRSARLCMYFWSQYLHHNFMTQCGNARSYLDAGKCLLNWNVLFDLFYSKQNDYANTL